MKFAYQATMTRYRKYLILIPVLTIFAGCSLFSSKTSDSEVVFAATEVGAPEGPSATKNIGPAGGTLASPDGRLTLTVPQNELTETLQFSIQPITNKSEGGIGHAYRLEPSGRTFTAPLAITIRYDDKDLEGTIPGALSLAYQDDSGAWHAQRSAKLDPEKKTLTVSTTHFSDWSWVSRLRLSPTQAALHVGETQYIELNYCGEPGFVDRLLKRPINCTSVSTSTNDVTWALVGEGHIEIAAHGRGLTYTAPARKPSLNVAYVFMDVVLEQWGQTQLEKKDLKLHTTITILDRGYRASGQAGDVTYSGLVCDLNQPFTVIGKHPLSDFVFNFVPAGPAAGTMSFVWSWKVITGKGNGSYTVEGVDTDNPRIQLQVSSSASFPFGAASGGGDTTIHLTPLTTGDCVDQ